MEKSDDIIFGSGIVEKHYLQELIEHWQEKSLEREPQRWIVEEKGDEKHYYRLKHPESGKYLTATSHDSLTIEGN